jgi:phosphohistidine swiveling domain-containing protein/uncharacterized protein (DUF2384 family)
MHAPHGAVEELGGKAVGLRWLERSGRPVPSFAVVPTGATTGLPREVLDLLDRVESVAVRSSSPDEDGGEHSFAGQFATELGVAADAASVEAAIDRVRRSANTDRVTAYAGGDMAHEMAVVVQAMVPAVVSGVAFSRHPVTGLDEVVVEAVTGRGDALVSGLVTPERWVFRWGAFTERPTDGDEALAEAVARGTRSIADAYGRAVDVEWAWDGETIWWLQVRPITGLDDVRVFSRRIAKEVLPGIISPLTWSVNVPVVNRAWITLLDRAVGDTGLEAGDLARRFGARAYFDMTSLGAVFERMGMPRDSLELLIGLDDGPEKPGMRPPIGTALLRAPRFASLAVWLLRYPGRVSDELTAIESDAAADRFDPDWSDTELGDAIGRAMVRAERAALANIVIPLMAQMASSRARSAVEAAGGDPDAIDPTAGVEGAGRHDPDRALDTVRAALSVAPEPVRAAAERGAWSELGRQDGADGVVGAVTEYLELFGALSDRTTDLTAVPWREEPGHVLRMASVPSPDRNVGSLDEVLPGARRVVRGRVARAGRLQVLREAVSQAYTRIYMDLRPLLMEAGRRLAAEGRLDAPDEVVFLEVGEVLEALAGGTVPSDRLAGRRREMEAAETYRVPDLIVGDDFVPIPRADELTEIRGVGSAGGRFSGPVLVVRNPASAPDVEAGTVVVVPHSDVSWTPLFARAAAIVAEAGGMLSHSSIVAREFGIPCVVSADGACDLADGTRVVVDGYDGIVTVIG